MDVVISEREGFDVKDDIKSYIESKKFNVKNTIKDFKCFKMMCERSKMYQLTYYPDFKSYNHTIIITCKIFYVIVLFQYLISILGKKFLKKY